MTGQRVAPGGLRRLGIRNWLVGRVVSRAAGVREAHLFTTLGRHRRLYRAWLLWSGALVFGGRLPRRESELVVLRVAHRCGSEYEWRHHERLGRRAGLSADEVGRVRDEGGVWKPADSVLLTVTDELLADEDVSDEAWRRLRTYWDERQAIELTLLVGQYRALAATIRTLRIAPDEPRSR